MEPIIRYSICRSHRESDRGSSDCKESFPQGNFKLKVFMPNVVVSEVEAHVGSEYTHYLDTRTS